MAGIGFRLQKLLKGDDSLLNIFRVYFYSASITTGPFLVIIAAILIVNRLALLHISPEETQLFQAIVVYIYAFSLIGVSPFIYVATRYLADKYYEKNAQAFTPAYLSVLEITFVIQSIIALVYLYFSGLPFSVAWLIFVMFLCVSGIWIAMAFLSAARSYAWITGAFIFGIAIGILLTLHWGTAEGIEGFVKGFTVGQATIFIVLTYRIFKEFGYNDVRDYSVFLYFRKYPQLIACGVFYYVGIWIDRFIFWLSPAGETTYIGALRVASLYDVPMFLAFVSIVPSMAFFLIQMETSFATHYHAYFSSIRARSPLDVIRNIHDAMSGEMTQNFFRYFVFQGIITCVLMIFAVPIGRVLFLSANQLGIFRVALLGAYMQFAIIIVINFMFYFEFHATTVVITLIFLVSNALFSLLSLWIGLPAYGYGYAAACYVTLGASLWLLNGRVKQLNYYIFMGQPVVRPTYKIETEGKPLSDPEYALEMGDPQASEAGSMAASGKTSAGADPR